MKLRSRIVLAIIGLMISIFSTAPLARAETVYTNPGASGSAFCGGGSTENLGFVSVLPGNAVTTFTFASVGSQFGGGIASFAIFSDSSYSNLIQTGSLGVFNFGFPSGSVTNYAVFLNGFLPSGYWQISLGALCTPVVSTAGYSGLMIEQELAPPGPVSLTQFAADGTTPIVRGGVTTGTTVIFGAAIQTSASLDPLQFQVEVQLSANAFTGNPTVVISSSGGQPVTATVSGLLDGSYHWAARVFDPVTHAATDWQPFSSSNTDFVVASALIVTSPTLLSDTTTTYSAGDPFVGGCCPGLVMSPGSTFYQAPAPFTIQSIVVDDTDLSLNNHDLFGNIRARISDIAGNLIASSTNTIYGESGCTGCSFQFQSEAVPQDFQLSLVVEDGIQGDGFFTVKNLRFFVTPQTGIITVSTNNAAATFSITDGASNTFIGSGVSFTQSAPPGTYTIQYGDLLGFITPTLAMASLSAGGTIKFNGTYIPLPPSLLVSPVKIDFGRQIIGMPSPTKNVTIQNSGGGILVPIINVSEDFLENNNCAAGLSAGNTCQITLTFKPIGSAARQGVLTILSQSPQLDQQISLSGFGALGFPLKGTTPGSDVDLTAYTALINTAFDHSMQNEAGQYQIYGCDKTVTDFLGETASSLPIKVFGCHNGYSQEPKAPFLLSAQYSGGDTLFYDGHPGYDYESKFGNSVFAAIAGVVKYPTRQELAAEGVTVGGDPDNLQVLELDAEDLKIFYLHLSTHPRTISMHLKENAVYQDFEGQPDSSFIPVQFTTTNLRLGSLEISGTVMAAGEPLASAKMQLSGITLGGKCIYEVTKTDHSGHYEFDHLAEGFYNLRPIEPGFKFQPASQPVTNEGLLVKAGDLIASSGNAGGEPSCFASHLHFEIQQHTAMSVTDHTDAGPVNLNFIPIDPYGWHPLTLKGDPYFEIPALVNAGLHNETLWELTPDPD